MARALLVILALAAVSCAAERWSQYAYNQVEELVSRYDVCTADVPSDPYRFGNPAASCREQFRSDVLYTSFAKEFFARTIPKCLTGYGVTDNILATVTECLTESFAKDLQPALEEADYSKEQREEIRGRILSCMNSIPRTRDHNPASYCASNSLMMADVGYPKETLVNFVVPCLNSMKVSAQLVADAEKCIPEVLASPLST